MMWVSRAGVEGSGKGLLLPYRLTFESDDEYYERCAEIIVDAGYTVKEYRAMVDEFNAHNKTQQTNRIKMPSF